MKRHWSDNPMLFLLACGIALVLFAKVHEVIPSSCNEPINQEEINEELLPHPNSDYCELQSCPFYNGQERDSNIPMWTPDNDSSNRSVPERTDPPSGEGSDLLE